MPVIYRNFRSVPDYFNEFKLVLDGLHEAGLKNVFLDGGTLLGAIREQNFILHDLDIDMGCYNTDFRVFIKSPEYKKLYTKLHADGYSLDSPDELTLKFTKFSKDGKTRYKMDLFAFVKAEEYYWHKCFGGIMTYPLECLDTLVPYNFKSIEVLIPNNVELFLSTVYGPTWKIPNFNFKKPFNYGNYHRLDDMVDLLKKYNAQKQGSV